MRLIDILEEEQKNLKETDIMGPRTRVEFNRRKKTAGSSVGNEEAVHKQRISREYDFSSFDRILQLSKVEQLRIARSMFAA
mgnify:CR=1 FL=1